MFGDIRRIVVKVPLNVWFIFGGLGMPALGGHQIAGNVGAVLYMTPLSIGVASSTLVARARRKALRRGPRARPAAAPIDSTAAAGSGAARHRQSPRNASTRRFTSAAASICTMWPRPASTSARTPSGKPRA
ncbi:multi antimicrobial extrusion protein MatE family [Burkholderia thailandensis MSMB121]|nr:multi antimicrobial extrusion protein MatE family [Burkholderia thailandensis MSMB121]